MTGLSERACEPLQTFVETVSGCSASRLDVPGTLSQAVKTQLVSDLGGVHGIWQILLVGENQKNSVSELVLIQHSLEFLPGLNHTVTIVAVDDEDDTLGILEVMSPERSNLVLSTNIPHGELNVLVFDSLNVETNRGDGCDDFTQLELIQNCGLSGSVQTNHQDSHLLLSPELVKQLRKRKTHDCGLVVYWLKVMFGSLLR